jgi:hypothetical protein
MLLERRGIHALVIAGTERMFAACSDFSEVHDLDLSDGG